jgi:RNA polymerase sigma-70 factor (ECF subfamily)
MRFLFRTLVNQNQRLVYSQAMYILANTSDAEDATQETYERLWNHLRKPLSNNNLDELQSHSLDSKPMAILAKKQLSNWLSSAIEKLKEPYRSLIILADLQQRSIKDVANRLDLNENQAKVYIHRGRKQLRVLLQDVEL